MEMVEFELLVEEEKASSRSSRASIVKDLAAENLEVFAKITAQDLDLDSSNYAIIYKTTDYYYYVVIDTEEEDYLVEYSEIDDAQKYATELLYNYSS